MTSLWWNSAREMKGEWTRTSTSFNGWGYPKTGRTTLQYPWVYKKKHQSAMAFSWNKISEEIINSFLGGVLPEKSSHMFHIFHVASRLFRMALSLRPTSLPWTCVLSTFGVLGCRPVHSSDAESMVGTSEALTWKVPSNQTQWQPEIAWELVMLCWFCCFFESPCIDVVFFKDIISWIPEV